VKGITLLIPKNRFEATVEEDSKKRDKIVLKIHAAAEALSGADLEDLQDRVQDVGKSKSDNKADKKVSVEIIAMA
jgi:hypothetical protein